MKKILIVSLLCLYFGIQAADPQQQQKEQWNYVIIKQGPPTAPRMVKRERLTTELLQTTYEFTAEVSGAIIAETYTGDRVEYIIYSAQ